MSIDSIAIIRIEMLRLSIKEEKSKYQPKIGVTTSPFEDLTRRVERALELGLGDLRRDGVVLESTMGEIEGAILDLANNRYFELVDSYVVRYEALLKQQECLEVNFLID